MERREQRIKRWIRHYTTLSWVKYLENAAGGIANFTG
jgi:hypothetical protein